MKKITYLLVLLCAMLSFAGCANNHLVDMTETNPSAKYVKMTAAERQKELKKRDTFKKELLRASYSENEIKNVLQKYYPDADEVSFTRSADGKDLNSISITRNGNTEVWTSGRSKTNMTQQQAEAIKNGAHFKMKKDPKTGIMQVTVKD